MAAERALLTSRAGRWTTQVGAVTGKSRSVLDPLLFSVTRHGWEVQQHRERVLRSTAWQRMRIQEGVKSQ